MAQIMAVIIAKGNFPRVLAVERFKIDSDGGPEPALLQYNVNCSTLGEPLNNKNGRSFSVAHYYTLLTATSCSRKPPIKRSPAI
jgi:hypothetical protein